MAEINQPKAHDSGSGKSPRSLIYVVDDEPMLLELASVILEPLGYVIKSFRDGESALESYTAAKPAPTLIITDYAMHKMNGLALAEACRRLHPRQKFLLISGTVDESILVGAPAKPDRFLAKPYQPRQLIDAVKSLLV